MTFEEYIKEKEEINRYVLNALKDDTSDKVSYEVCSYNTHGHYCCKKYSDAEEYMHRCKNLWRTGEHVGKEVSCALKWEITKRYSKGQTLVCNISEDGELIRFFSFPIDKDKFLYAKTDVLYCIDVEVPYETGDILKVRNGRLHGKDYIIYCYDEEKYGNKHLMLTLNPIRFGEIYWLDKAKKVSKCPDEKINEMRDCL